MEYNMKQSEKDILLYEAVKNVSSTPDGRRFLQWLFNQCRVDKQLAGEEFPTVMFYEGRRSIGIAAQTLLVKVLGSKHAVVDIEEFDRER